MSAADRAERGEKQPRERCRCDAPDGCGAIRRDSLVGLIETGKSPERCGWPMELLGDE